MLSKTNVRLFLLSFKAACVFKILPFKVYFDQEAGGRLSFITKLNLWRISAIFVIIIRMGLTYFFVKNMLNTEETDSKIIFADAFMASFYVSVWIMTTAIHVYYILIPNISKTHINSLIFLNHHAGISKSLKCMTKINEVI